MAWTSTPQQTNRNQVEPSIVGDGVSNNNYSQVEWSGVEDAYDSPHMAGTKRARYSDDCQTSAFVGSTLRSQHMQSSALNSSNHGGWQTNSSQRTYRGLSSGNPTLAGSSNTRQPQPKPTMRTGCIPCLLQGIACSPENPNCKHSMLEDWNPSDRAVATSSSYGDSAGLSLTAIQPYSKWRRNWRERHSLNFFATFTAPQLAGFFNSSFWQRTVIQTSFQEPAVLHAIIAVGALHESILHRPNDHKRTANAMEFALAQCNKAISCLTTAQRGIIARDLAYEGRSKLALITCVLFTCFEAMQGRSDSAVNHALQGRALLAAASPSKRITELASSDQEVEQLRPIVERLELQATSLLVKGKRPEDNIHQSVPSLTFVDVLYSMEHAHDTLHNGLNSIMRLTLSFKHTRPVEVYAETIDEQQKLASWVAHWETAFSNFLAQHKPGMPDLDLNRASVLQVNHLVGKILSNADHRQGPAAFDSFEADFRTIVDLSRGVLTAFSCPPLPTLSGGSAGAPYVSFSLWVTDPLWIATTRCRTNSIRHAAFTMLAQNPRQEGIWHAGPQTSPARQLRQADVSKPFKNASYVKPKSAKRSWTETKSSEGMTGSLPTRATAIVDSVSPPALRIKNESTGSDGEPQKSAHG